MATVDSPNVITQAGKYNLNKVRIISYRKNDAEGVNYEMDIKPITLTIELTEDIFTGFINGRIAVKDSQDVRSVLPITGLERLELSFNTPGMPGYHAVRDEGHPYYIYKIDGAKQDPTNPRAQFYIIHFCSSEMYFNSFNRLSRAYTGPIEEGVQNILHSKEGLRSDKKFVFEPTRSNTKYVIPNLKPFDAIKLMSRDAISSNYENAGYLFYETGQTFAYRSVESMLGLGGSIARPAVLKYNYQIANLSKTDVQNDLTSVKRYEFKRPVDLLFNLNEGMFASKLIKNDLYNKTITEHNFDYLSNFGKHFHTEHENGDKAKFKGVLPISKFSDTNKDLSEQYMAKLLSVTDTSNVHTGYSFPDPTITYQNRISQRLQMRNVNLNLQVYGNTLLHAGDVITFDMPLLRPLADPKARSKPNPYWSGRYLVMAVKHIISQEDEQHLMNLRCMKDAVRIEFDAETEQSMITDRTYKQKLTNLYDLDELLIQDDLLQGL